MPQETATSPVKGVVAKVSGTGTKTDTPLIETPQAISVVTRDQMNQQGAQTVNQALQYTSGVAVDTRSAFTGFDIIYSRGFAIDRYLDGLRYPSGANFTSPQLELYGLERLEVLHGPASMLYGSSSPGGLVDAISKRPLDEPYHEVALTFGNFQHLEAAFDFSGPVDADKKWSYRLTGLTRDFDSQVDFNGQERYWIAPALTWRPTTGTTITFLGNIQHDPSVGLYSQLPLLDPVAQGKLSRSLYLGEPDYNINNRDQQSIGYAIESHLDEAWTLRQNLRYMHTDGAVGQFLPLPPDFFGPVDPAGNMQRYRLTQTSDADAFQVDTNAEAKFWTGPLAHKFLFGVDYQRFTEKAFVDQALADPINVFNPVYGDLFAFSIITSDTDQVLNQTGLYFQDQVKWDRLVLTIGGRQDFSQVSTVDLLGPDSNNDDTAFTERVGLTYLIDGGFAPYASYSTSFQPSLGTDAAGNEFAPTEGEQYEIGIKYQPNGYNALYTLAAYDLTQQNVITSDPANPAFRVQTGEIRSRGIEGEAKVSVSDNFDLIGSYTYIDAEITKDLNPIRVGKRPINIPNQTAALWGFYKFYDGALDGFGFGGGFRFVGNSPGSEDNSIIVPDYTLVDIAASYDFARLSPNFNGMTLQLNVTNLADREYVSQCTNQVTCVFGNGRTILTTLRYQW